MEIDRQDCIARIAPLIGAAADEVTVADSTSVNLFKLLVAAARQNPGRSSTIASRCWRSPTSITGRAEFRRCNRSRRLRAPPMLSLLALESALEVFDAVTIATLRAKSIALGDHFIRLADVRLEGFGFELVSDRTSRGSSR